ncbi:IclR family transcriptional regulator [Azorhizobium oxalatiphilum]|uniref:IclR family transcriptional regulator n=1 Tax=Azorhizobium oxalatiphilum TaxID=980631 RepID=A0A917CBS6_9HYPH|nr:IclR family transcriptional regulator [Azorhizobium oxalatiphilum]GGF82064.1 IclR family transcriptional regulator [Azorhizobium oxalatiphilum]
MSDSSTGAGRLFAVLRQLAAGEKQGMRLKDLAAAVDLPRPTAHRLLHALMAEGMVEHDPRTKLYRLGLELFVLAARAGSSMNLRDLARPGLLRLTAALGETIFLMVRNGFDAVCIDRSAGPLPIRSFTGDVGGTVMLGIGQAAMAILAFLPDAEQDEVIRYNLPRMRALSAFDEGFLRAEMARVKAQGFSDGAAGLIPGMAGLGVPILGRTGEAVAALSVGSTTDRMTPERNKVIADLLKREAADIGLRLNPFDPALRRPGAAIMG